MKNRFKNIFRAVLLFLFLLCLTGCNDMDSHLMIDMVKGDLTALYLNEYDETYLNLCDMTKEEGEALYKEGIQYDAEYFCYYWGIIDDGEVTYADLDKKLQEEIYHICDTISKKTKFDVKSAVKQDEESYSVKVIVETIDVMEKANVLYDKYEPLNAFWERTENVDYMTIPAEEYLAYRNEYGFIMVDLMKEVLPNLGYSDQKSLNIQVELIDDFWTTNEDDLATFYEYHLSYPY